MKQKILLILILSGLFLIPTIVNAQTSCDNYCRGGVYYYDGEYDSRTRQCEYSDRRTCDYGCNGEGTACASAPVRECEDYCSGGVYYYDGTYNTRTKECEYAYRRVCEYGCNARGTECESVPVRECDDYCRGGVYYYDGTYNTRTKECEYAYRRACEYGCDPRGMECAGAQETSDEDFCTDTDKGKNFNEAGSVTWENAFDNSEGTLEDHCVGNEIVEYYCQENNIRNVAYKDCSEEGLVCKNAVCVEIEPGECTDPDGNNVTTKTWVEGTNIWNEGLLSWGDYCSEEPDGGSTETGPYVHEAICLETEPGYYEVRYAPPQKCKDGCIDGVCVGNGEVEPVFEEEIVDDEYVRCPAGCSCMTREAGAKRFTQPKMCLEDPCDRTVNGTLMYCINAGEVEEVVTRCTDSDGRDIYTKGRTTGWNFDKTTMITSVDYCTDSDGGAELLSGKWVAEEQCDDEDKVHTYYYECPENYWCSDGKCIYRPVRNERINVRIRNGTEAEVTGDALIIRQKNRTYEIEYNVDEAVSRYVRRTEVMREVEIVVEEDKPVYNIRKTRRVRFFGFIPRDMEVIAKVDATNLTLTEELKPLWSMLTLDYFVGMADSDNDGVSNNKDLCEGTPEGTIVGSDGCPHSHDTDLEI